jgi:hypothetical protein
VKTTAEVLSAQSNYNDDLEEDRIKQRYLNGEYKLILQLLGVLENGRLAKKLTDSAIDLCEHMQNLRKAIFDYKLRVEALEVGSRKVCIKPSFRVILHHSPSY